MLEADEAINLTQFLKVFAGESRQARRIARQVQFVTVVAVPQEKVRWRQAEERRGLFEAQEGCRALGDRRIHAGTPGYEAAVRSDG